VKENFKRALAFTLAHECVFEPGHYGEMDHVMPENVSGDRGGVTKFGIDQRAHPHINIRGLDYYQAAEIYRDNEWTRCRCDDLPGGYDIAVFDIAVLSGCGEAVLLLQRALNHAGTEPSLKEDCFIGPKTISAAHRGGAAGLERLLQQRENLFHAIVERHPGDKKFLPGWMERNQDLAAQIRNPKSEIRNHEEAIA
jgi:lysozyme family protein